MNDQILKTLEAARDVLAAELDTVEQTIRRFDPARAAEHGRQMFNVRWQLERVLVAPAQETVAIPMLACELGPSSAEPQEGMRSR
jgi:hypothetical protein